MLKRTVVIVVAMLLVSSSMVYGAGAPKTGRTWEYLNLTLLLSPNWAFVILPGHRYEFSRKTASDAKYADEKYTYFWEFFAGPVYMQKFGDLTLKLPLWYYYMGFPLRHKDSTGEDYYYSHNIEFLPIVEYKYKDWKFINRVIFHNKFYANNSYYETKTERWGYSLTLREMFTIEYNILPVLALTVADELFFGLVEDADTKDDPAPNPKGEPFYEVEGFNMNRLYVGLIYRFTPTLSLSPQYVYETQYDPDNNGKVTSYNHYIYLTLTYVIKMY